MRRYGGTSWSDWAEAPDEVLATAIDVLESEQTK